MKTTHRVERSDLRDKLREKIRAKLAQRQAWCDDDDTDSCESSESSESPSYHSSDDDAVQDPPEDIEFLQEFGIKHGQTCGRGDCYRVLCGLGVGCYTRTWLCVDERSSRCSSASASPPASISAGLKLVAVKVCGLPKKPDPFRVKMAQHEVQSLSKFQEGTGSDHVYRLLSHFWMQGPRGRHFCRCYEVLDVSLRTLLKQFDHAGLPHTVVQKIAADTLRGLSSIHSCGIIHGYIKTSNVMIARRESQTLQDVVSDAWQFLRDRENNGTPNIKQLLKDARKPRCRNKQNSSAEELIHKAELVPKELEALRSCLQKRSWDSTFELDHICAKLVDFDAATETKKSAAAGVLTDRQGRPPEQIIGVSLDEKGDCWSAACMFFELITGAHLFNPSHSEKASRDEHHLKLMVELLGGYPPCSWVLQGRYAHKYFVEEAEMTLTFRNLKMPNMRPLLDVLRSDYGQPPEEAVDIADFLTPLLQWRPTVRQSASGALRHLWLVGVAQMGDSVKPEVSVQQDELQEVERKQKLQDELVEQEAEEYQHQMKKQEEEQELRRKAAEEERKQKLQEKLAEQEAEENRQRRKQQEEEQEIRRKAAEEDRKQKLQEKLAKQEAEENQQRRKKQKEERELRHKAAEEERKRKLQEKLARQEAEDELRRIEREEKKRKDDERKQQIEADRERKKKEVELERERKRSEAEARRRREEARQRVEKAEPTTKTLAMDSAMADGSDRRATMQSAKPQSEEIPKINKRQIKLSYAGIGLTDQSIYDMDVSLDLCFLQELDFSQNELGDLGLERVVEICARSKDLLVLKLYKNKLGDGSVRLLAELIKQCHQLRELHLSHNRFTAVGIVSMIKAAAQWRPHGVATLWLRLEHNSLADCQDVIRLVSDESLSVCPRCSKCPQFKCYFKAKVHVPYLGIPPLSDLVKAEANSCLTTHALEAGTCQLSAAALPAALARSRLSAAALPFIPFISETTTPTTRVEEEDTQLPAFDWSSFCQEDRLGEEQQQEETVREDSHGEVHEEEAVSCSAASSSARVSGTAVHHAIVLYTGEAEGYLSVAPKDLVQIAPGAPSPGDPLCRFHHYVFGRKCSDGMCGWLPVDVLSTAPWVRYSDESGRPWLHNAETDEWHWEAEL